MKTFIKSIFTVLFLVAAVGAHAGSLETPNDEPPITPVEPRPEGFSTTLLVIAGVLAVLLIAANAEQDD